MARTTRITCILLVFEQLLAVSSAWQSALTATGDAGRSQRGGLVRICRDDVWCCRSIPSIKAAAVRRERGRSTAVGTRSSALSLYSLPSCPPEKIVQVAATSGAVAISSQLALTKMFLRSKDTVRQNNASYTAHCLVALVLMVLVSAVGSRGWYLHPPFDTTAYTRLFSANAEARWLASVILGAFAAWDVPVSLKVKRLRKADVVIHHICMTVLAALGAAVLPTRYILYYFGVAELSSIPLIVYDQLAAEYEEVADGNTDEGSSHTNSRLKRIRVRRDVFQAVAAVAFILVRVYSFTRVTIGQFVPDCLTVLQEAGLSRNRACMVKGIMASSLAFTALQLYWFTKLLRFAFGSGENDAGGEMKIEIVE